MSKWVRTFDLEPSANGITIAVWETYAPTGQQRLDSLFTITEIEARDLYRELEIALEEWPHHLADPRFYGPNREES